MSQDEGRLRACAIKLQGQQLNDKPGKTDEELLTEEYIRLKGKDNDNKAHSNRNAIPRFYYKLPDEDDIVMQKLREESRALLLQRKSQELLDNNELQGLWYILDRYHTLSSNGEDKMISYEDFMKVSSECGPKCRLMKTMRLKRSFQENDIHLHIIYIQLAKLFFNAVTFSRLLQGDPYGRISIMQFFNYTMRKVWMHQTRIGLSLYDVTGQGYLREPDLENYILELIPTLPQLSGLEKSFHSFYVCTAVRKFFFFLDSMRTGRIKIVDILNCTFLDELLELRDEDLPQERQNANWFSATSALRVYGQYLNLDTDHNGMLSRDELSKYGTGTLTNVFLDRVFQECLTYEGELDYKAYLDFVLAMENRGEPQALQYIFRLLDVQGVGHLNIFALNYFFKAIQEQVRNLGQQPVHFEDVKDEIFDMVKPLNPLWITLQDLIDSCQGEVVTNILIDLNGFWNYENREMLMAESAAD